MQHYFYLNLESLKIQYVGLSDPLFIFFVTLTIMFIFIKKSKFFYISFIFAVLAGFTRYEGLLLIIPILISFFIRKNFEKQTIIKLIIGMILCYFNNNADKCNSI